MALRGRVSDLLHGNGSTFTIADFAGDDVRSEASRLLQDYPEALHEQAIADLRSQELFMQERLRVTLEEYGGRPPSRTQQADDLIAAYFGGLYFSYQQAATLDALRGYILAQPQRLRDRMMSAWILTADRAMNGVGHSAQFLLPRNNRAYSRLLRARKIDVVATFESILATMPKPRLGSASTVDALGFLGTLPDEVVAFLDPPYTRDQYSRFYSVHETLALYDWPEVGGRGLSRVKRNNSIFSQARGLDSAFHALFAKVAEKKMVGVLSYPDTGLLATQSEDVHSIAAEYVEILEVWYLPSRRLGTGRVPGRGVEQFMLFR